MEKLSYPIQLLNTVSRGTNETTGYSHQRLSDSMHSAMKLAIVSKMKFDKDDFKEFAKFWSFSERYYELACKENISAAISFEAWKNRKPFIADMIEYGWQGAVKRNKGRLAVSSSFWWNGEKVTVTSFSGDGTYLIACSYKDKKPDEYRNKIKHQYKITHKDLRNYRAELKKIADSNSGRKLNLSIPEVCRQIEGFTIQEVWEKIEECEKTEEKKLCQKK